MKHMHVQTKMSQGKGQGYTILNDFQFSCAMFITS